MTIPGFATAAGTRQMAERFADRAFNLLGRTGLVVSRTGFGCYRVDAGRAVHAAALAKALSSGVNLIDTSANYADGGSEQLVGRVIADLVAAGTLNREQVVVVSKGGYLQGENFALHRRREAAGRAFPEVTLVKEGLAHCIHPEFLGDQIGRSLDRLGLEALDGYLLHNPEYYLDWAGRQGMAAETARSEYHRRIQQALQYLESEVQRGRIRFYGISSNTFPAPADDPEFTGLQRIWEAVEATLPEHHFQAVQMPFNLLEAGAVLAHNQPDGKAVLGFAREKNLAVLVNRPLNAFTGKRMVRLAGIDVRQRLDYRTIIDRIKELAQSETRLWRKILPDVASIPGGVRIRIKQQGCFAEALKHHWRSFGSYERWREAKDGIFLPRVQAVMDYLAPHAETHPELARWIPAHQQALGQALRAVGSIYAADAVALEKKIIQMVDRADAQWAGPGSLSQKALRALISTAGVTTVLVGMRTPAYVDDVLAADDPAIEKQDRTRAWQRLAADSREVFPD